MIPYIALILVPAVPLLLNNGKQSPQSSRWSFSLFFLILLFLLSTKADYIGNDTYGYIYKFQQYSSMTLPQVLREHEPLYSLLNFVVSKFTSNYRWFFAVTALLSTAPIYVLFKKYSNKPFLTITLFVIMSNFVMLFSGIRQSIAIAFGIIAFEWLKEKKYFLFVLTVLTAFLFHNSAFMLIFMWPLYKFRVTKKSLIFLSPLIVVIAIFNKPIFMFLSQFVSDYYTVNIRDTGAFTMLILFILFVVFAYIIPDESKITPEIMAMRNFLLFSMVIQLFTPINSQVMRLGYYYTVFLPPLIANIVDISSYRWKKVAFVAEIVMVLFFTCYFFTGAYSDNSLHTFPFVFFWEQ